MDYTIELQPDGTYSIVDDSGSIVESGIATYAIAQALIDDEDNLLGGNDNSLEQPRAEVLPEMRAGTAMERRTFSSGEVRMTRGSNTITGIAARYNVTTHIAGSYSKLKDGGFGGFHERIAPGAFDKVLRTSPDVCCLFNHNVNMILGRTSSGTLNLRSDDNGLHYTCDLPNTSAARDLKESIKRRDVSGSSFAFTLVEGDDSFSEEEDENRGKRFVRTIHNFTGLHDVSPVVNPAYDGTAVGVDERNFVPAEVRSRAERIARIHSIGSKWRARCTALGVTSEVSFEDVQEIVRRRKDLLDFVLD